MIRRKIRRAIDACRPGGIAPGGSDLSLPEMNDLAARMAHDPAARALYDQTQAFDARVALAARQGAVPEGLAERILARIAAEGNSAASTEPPADTIKMDVPVAPITRRRWFWRAAALLAAAALGGSGYAILHGGAPLSSEWLVAHCGDWHDRLATGAEWRPLDAEARDGFPLPAALNPRVRPQKWCDASAWAGRAAVAYNVGFNGHRATLFVIPEERPIAGSTPPASPDSSSGGQTIGCWQAGGFVYVLVIEGDEQLYRALLDVSEAPVA